MNKKINRALSSYLFNTNLSQPSNYNNKILNKNDNSFKSEYNIFTFKNNQKNLKRNTQFNIFSPFQKSKTNMRIFTEEEIQNILKNNNNEYEEYNSNENSLNLKKNKKFGRAKSHSIMIINNNNNINFDDMNTHLNKYKSNREYNPNFFMTSSSLTSNRKNRNNITKKNIKKNKSFYGTKKVKPIEVIIKEAERKFEKNYKKPKSFLSLLNELYKTNLKSIKNMHEKHKIDYDFIKSDLGQKTISIEKKQKLNLLKMKEYSHSHKYVLGPKDSGLQLQNDMYNFKNKHYLNSKNLEILKNFQINEINTNETNLLGSINIKEYYKDKRPDSFKLSEFCKKLNKLNDKVAYKYRYIFADKLGFNWDDIYIYKKTGRNIILNNRKNSIKYKYQNRSKNQRPDDLFI